jgi:hypothetical protein
LIALRNTHTTRLYAHPHVNRVHPPSPAAQAINSSKAISSKEGFDMPYTRSYLLNGGKNGCDDNPQMVQLSLGGLPPVGRPYANGVFSKIAYMDPILLYYYSDGWSGGTGTGAILDYWTTSGDANAGTVSGSPSSYGVVFGDPYEFAGSGSSIFQDVYGVTQVWGGFTPMTPDTYYTLAFDAGCNKGMLKAEIEWFVDGVGQGIPSSNRIWVTSNAWNQYILIVKSPSGLPTNVISAEITFTASIIQGQSRYYSYVSSTGFGLTSGSGGGSS